MSTKGKTRWFPRDIRPVRKGSYECIVRLAGRVYVTWMLEWDGIGFVVPIPMVVLKWRGQTRAACFESAAHATT